MWEKGRGGGREGGGRGVVHRQDGDLYTVLSVGIIPSGVIPMQYCHSSVEYTQT